MRAPRAPRPAGTLRTAALLGAVACAVVAPLAVHWAAGQTLVWFDTQRLYAPQRWLVDEALRAFRLPLWNPFMGGGVPFLADAIHGAVHPVSVLTAWLGTDRSVDVLVGAYVACSGVGAALVARELGASRSGAALAGSAYGLSGFVLSMSGNLVFLAGAGTLPFCVAGLRRFATRPGPGALAAAAAGAAALALSGDAQALVVAGALSLVLAWEAGGARGALRGTAAGVLGLALAAVQLVPSAVHLPRTVRGEGTWAPDPAVWAFDAWRLCELVLPGIASGPDPYADPVYAALAGPGAWPPNTTPMPFAASVFVGIVPLALAVAGARTGRRGAVLAALAAVLLWLALGPALGADRVTGAVPLWRAFRYSEKLVGPLALVLSALAALGLDAVADRRVPGWQAAAAGAVLALAAVAAVRLEVAALDPGVAALAEARVWRGTWHLLAGCLALGGWLLLRDRLAGRSGAALAAAAWAGMAAASPLALRPGDASARLAAPGPALAAPPPGPRIATPYQHDLSFPEPGPDAMDRAAREHALLGYPAYNVRARVDTLNEYSAAPSRRLALLGGEGWSQWPLGPRRYGATHVILDPPVTPLDRILRARVIEGATLVDAAPDRYEIWAVPHRPWVWFAEQVRSEPDEAAAIARTFAEPDDAAPRVVIEAAGRFDTGPGRILSVERGLETLRVEAESSAPGTLVVADAWWPGWEAAVDGAAVTVFRADAFVRAVRWPAGRHVLEMRYRPREVRAGLLVSAAGAVALAASMALLRRRRAAEAP